MLSDIYRQNRTDVKGIRTKKYGIGVEVLGIYVSNDVVYMHICMYNDTNISFEVDSRRFIVADRKLAKRTAQQQTPLEILRVCNDPAVVRGHQRQRTVFALPKLTISDDKVLLLEIIEKNDYQGCKEGFLSIMAMEVPFTEAEFNEQKHEDLCEKAFQKAMERFRQKTDMLASVANPVIKKVYEEHGAMYENIMVPITDGRRIYQISTPLKEAYETESQSVVKAFEKAIVLHTIDEAWKENLRELDELKHSVQNASYEQKDPLLIFKLESVKLFDSMVDKINNQTISVLMRGQIPVQAPADVKEVASEQPQRPRERYVESRSDLTDPAQKAAASRDTREQRRPQPVVAEKMPGRNDPCPCGSGKKFKNCHGRGL